MGLRYLVTLPGLLKLLSILFLVIAVSLGGYAFENSLYNIYIRYWSAVKHDFLDDKPPGLGRERCFIAFTTLVLILAVFSLIGHVFINELEKEPRVKMFDTVFHVVGAILLITGGCLLIASSRRINSSGCNRIPEKDAGFKCQIRAGKDFGGIFAFASGAIFIVIAVLRMIGSRIGLTGASSSNV